MQSSHINFHVYQNIILSSFVLYKTNNKLLLMSKPYETWYFGV